MRIDYGKWDSWGFGIAWQNYEKSLSIDFIHWYVVITFYKLWRN